MSAADDDEYIESDDNADEAATSLSTLRRISVKCSSNVGSAGADEDEEEEEEEDEEWLALRSRRR
jgi:hypothetical protein